MPNQISPIVDLRSRLIDICLLTAIATLFATGVLSDTRTGTYAYRAGFESSIQCTFIVCVGLLGVFFPFRVHTRVLWLLLAPLTVISVPILGLLVRRKLRTAPGLQLQLPTAEFYGFEIICTFLAAVLVCLLVNVVGWRLSSQRKNTRTAELTELFVLTAIVGCLLVLFRDAMNPNVLLWFFSPPRNWHNHLYSLILLLPIIFKHAMLIFVGLYFSPRFAVAATLCVIAVTLVGEYAYAHFKLYKQLPSLTSGPEWYHLKAHIKPHFEAIIRQLSIVLLTVLGLRLNGYRFTWQRSGFLATKANHT